MGEANARTVLLSVDMTEPTTPELIIEFDIDDPATRKAMWSVVDLLNNAQFHTKPTEDGGRVVTIDSVEKVKEIEALLQAADYVVTMSVLPAPSAE